MPTPIEPALQDVVDQHLSDTKAVGDEIVRVKTSRVGLDYLVKNATSAYHDSESMTLVVTCAQEDASYYIAQPTSEILEKLTDKLHVVDTIYYPEVC